ncbi:MAG TPA: alpha/beta hydrolase [Alphaproteobacteria bacterium]|nr:alpha/beta hydrolase [Alphaproteobacteria bacterium]
MIPSYVPLPDGTRLAYCRSGGRGPGVVFLGGFRSDMTGTKAVALEAWCRAEGRAFLRLDYSGHGASDGAFAEGTVGRWAADALAVFDAATEGPQVLVGSSMGGWIALLLALARRERVAGLVGIAAAPDFTEDLMWGRFTEGQRRTLMEAGALHVPSAYSAEPTPLTRRLIEEGRDHLLLRGPIDLPVPVRLLHGMADPDVPWETSLRLAGALTGGDVRLTLVKDGDHRLSRPADIALIGRIVGELLESLG